MNGILYLLKKFLTSLLAPPALHHDLNELMVF